MVYQKTQKVWNVVCCYAPLALAATRARIAIAAAVLTQTLPARCHRFRPGLQCSQKAQAVGGSIAQGGGAFASRSLQRHDLDKRF